MMSFSILDHIEKLEPVQDLRKKGYYHCPVCGDDNFTFNPKNGAYTCHGNGCQPKDIRQALSPVEGIPRLEPIKLQRLNVAKAEKETALNTAEVQAKAEELALLVAEDIYTPEQAALSMSEWCRTNGRDKFSANQLLRALLKQVVPSDDELETIAEDAKALKALAIAYAHETRLTESLVIRERLRRRFRLTDSQIEGLIEELEPSANIDLSHVAESSSEASFVQRITKLRNGEILPGINTGFVDMDRMLNGLSKKSLTIIGGRPSQGKTAFTQSIVRHIAKQTRLPIVMFNLEMTNDQWKERWVSAERSIKFGRVHTGRLSDPEYDSFLDCVAYLEDLPIYLCEESGISPSYLRRVCMAAKERFDQGIGLIVVDYLNLMRSPGAASRVQEVSQIARDLQSIAKEFNAPVVALSQLNRGASNRAVKDPVLEDLRESGELEQVADAVFFVHRPGKYDESIPDNIGKIICAKNRHGATGSFEVLFEGEYMRFRDFDSVSPSSVPIYSSPTEKDFNPPEPAQETAGSSVSFERQTQATAVLAPPIEVGAAVKYTYHGCPKSEMDEVIKYKEHPPKGTTGRIVDARWVEISSLGGSWMLDVLTDGGDYFKSAGIGYLTEIKEVSYGS